MATRLPCVALSPFCGGKVLSSSHNGRCQSLKLANSSYARFQCSANSHVNSFNKPDPFLNLHPEVSLLRGEGKGNSGGKIIEDFSESSITSDYSEAKIKVVGVGGGGSNAVNRMTESAMTGIEFWIVNTDVQAMRTSPVDPGHRLQIGKDLTRGLGAGGSPDVGSNAAKESKGIIEEALYGSDMVFVTVSSRLSPSPLFPFFLFS